MATDIKQKIEQQKRRVLITLAVFFWDVDLSFDCDLAFPQANPNTAFTVVK
ncbi:hypothetical protein JCM19237_1657 [Photobacterium aphoticum]|uniref:Uncharacterized protein n=1 Tax=Photobacterium aphoticum TaxID=754436 RepID=A0A090REP7_9GAMM|nr:hypothetical protein JCM19237_1657 [Photobacterium aphoticum]